MHVCESGFKSPYFYVGSYEDKCVWVTTHYSFTHSFSPWQSFTAVGAAHAYFLKMQRMTFRGNNRRHIKTVWGLFPTSSRDLSVEGASEVETSWDNIKREKGRLHTSFKFKAWYEMNCSPIKTSAIELLSAIWINYRCVCCERTYLVKVKW